ncbi:MAG: TonB-dependent siderophore receptor [Betaproteobacteria bacterium]|nr:TonB-dependent siderophore receptor [Betaproteobacteria bacterium]
MKHRNTLAPTLLATALAAALGARAQTAPSAAVEPEKKDAQKLKPVLVQDQAEQQGKDSIRATTTTSFKGNQDLRDIPQSVTVVTEKLINDRKLDTVREALNNTAGVTFLAAEGGEEDIRLRGFSLAATGDIFLDGMRDAAFYDRDTFNLDRIDVLRGSASMLFGRGSTGGVANQVSKTPTLLDEKSVTLSIGSHQYRRVVADLNQTLARDTAVRATLMRTEADNNGAGTRLDKQGAAIALHHDIGHRHEYQAKFYFLDNDNGVNYGLPWIRPHTSSTSAENTILPGLAPEAYYGAASDSNAGSAKIATLGHVFRASAETEVKTQLRHGDYTRDLRASTIRFAAGNIAANTLAGFGPQTVFTRGAALKVQDLEATQVQSDLSTRFDALGAKHALIAGIDIARDERVVYAARSAAQGGVSLAKPSTTAGTPNDGASIDEGSRVLRRGNDFTAKSWGVYAQDTAAITPHVKLIAGLRYDRLEGAYNTYAIPNNAAGPETVTSYRQDISEWSHRVGALYQPNDVVSYHVSWGTSFNTSGDTYSFNALSANTPPESSENIEIGGRFESFDQRLTTRVALFRSTKKNERNTDPDTAATRLLLSGKRHASGLEIDVAGRITQDWELYVSTIWIPTARVDVAAGTATTVGNRMGDRPGLTPRHAGTVWTTYQATPKLRVGGGLNYRARQAPADVTAPPWEAPAFTTGDLFAEYKLDNTWTFKANITNVTDKYYADTLYRGHYIPGVGRLVQGTVVVNF